MHEKHANDAHFYFVYIREAHPTDGRQSPQNVKDKILIADPKTLEERRKVAKEFVRDFQVSLPVLVDTIDDTVGKAYSAAPDRLYVIDTRGKLAYVGAPGPRGFKPAEVSPVLNRLLGRTVLELAPPPRPVDRK